MLCRSEPEVQRAQSVRNMCTRLGLVLPKEPPRCRVRLRLTLILTPEERAQLKRIASARRIAQHALVQQIVAVILDDQLVDAVLDDRG